MSADLYVSGLQKAGFNLRLENIAELARSHLTGQLKNHLQNIKADGREAQDWLVVTARWMESGRPFGIKASAVKPAPGPTYTLVYHDSLGFRAAPVQMLLIDAGVGFEMATPEWSDDGSWRVVKDNPGMSVFAPPVLRKGDFTLSQTMAIMQYLANQHGYNCGNAQEDTTMLQLLLDIGGEQIEIERYVYIEGDE